MVLFEKAADFVIKVLSENEEFKRFPKDFVMASLQWVRSWFLKDDPKMEEKLRSDKSEDYKMGVIESKLETLLEHPGFKEELEAKLSEMDYHLAGARQTFKQNKSVSNSTITAGRDIHIGDKKEKYEAGGNIHITHNYGHHPSEKQPASLPMTKPTISANEIETFRQLIAHNQVKDVIDRLAKDSFGHDTFRNIVLGLSNRWDQVKNHEIMGVLNFSEAGAEKQKIVASTLDLLNEINLSSNEH